MIDQNAVYAVVWASNNPEKYGHKIYLDLLNGWYKVYPVNLHESEIAGHQAFVTCGDLPEPVDVAIFVVPPQVTESLIPMVHKLGIKHVWMQPGAENDQAIALCEKYGIECTHNACIMLKRREV